MSANVYTCIHCGTPLPALYEQYGDTHIRLIMCEVCHCVADKYIEYDNVLLFIDLILIKPPAYRHTIFNVLLPSNGNPGSYKGKKNTKKNTSLNTKIKINNSFSSNTNSMITPVNKTNIKNRKSWTSVSPIWRLAILMLLFEVYVTWAYQEKSFIENKDNTSLIISIVLQGPIQYLYFLSTTILQNFFLCFFLSYFGLQWLKFPSVPSGTTITLPSISRSSSPVPSLSPSPRPQLAQQLRLPSNHQIEYPLISITNCSSNKIDLKSQNEFQSKPTLERTFKIMFTTVLISNTIKLFPIVMLIWPYDPPILHATRLLVRIVHLLLLIEAVHIVLVDPKKSKRKSIYKNMESHQSYPPSSSSSSEYYRVALVVITSELIRLIASHLIVIFVVFAIWGISVREIAIDDWKMFKVGIKLIEELGVYILGDI